MKNQVKYFLCGYLIVLVPTLFPCEIPVFRYTLERWPADKYTLLVKIPKDKALSKAESALIQKLTVGLAGEGGHANASLKLVKADTPFTSIELRYPKESGILRHAWKGLLNEDNVTNLLNSPVREKLQKSILNGESIIWIIVESGNQEQDDAFEKSLKAYLSQAGKDLKLSDGIIQMDDADKIDAMSTKKELDNLIRSTVPLKISFDTIRLSRSDPQEDILLDMLLGQSVSLADTKETLAIPIFGRGRCLEGIPASKLTLDNLKKMTTYLCSGCSCTVKAESPGVDIIMNVPWNDHISDTVMTVKALPPLTGIIQKPNAIKTDVQKKANENIQAETKDLTTSKETSQSPLFLILIAIALSGIGISYYSLRK